MSTNQTARLLGQRMRAMRLKAGASTYYVENLQLGVSRRTLGRAEKGETFLNWATWRAIADCYGATAAELEEVEEMARHATEKGWWERSSKAARLIFRRFMTLEEQASRLRILEVELVTGLFQTGDYIRAVSEADPFVDEETVAKQIARRELRQHRVIEEGRTPQIQLVLTEGALMRRIGGPFVHMQQIEHLRKLNRRPEIEIRVLPNNCGAYPTMSGAFTLLEFDGPDDPDTVYIEGRDGCRYVEDREIVNMYGTIADVIYGQAISLEEFWNDDSIVAQVKP